MTDQTSAILRASDVRRTYRMGRVETPILKGVDFAVEAGEFVAVLGASGSGKSTLLHLLGGLDRPDKSSDPTSGVFFRNKNIARYSRRELNAYRNESVGFVFQFYHLLPELNVLENVLIGAMIRESRLGYMRHREELKHSAIELLAAFGLADRLKHRPRELSGGELQRVAIARALMNRPPVLLADEPTGNLDRRTGQKILDALGEVQGRLGQTIVMVTHDPAIAHRADRIVELVDGLLVGADAEAVSSGSI